MKKTVLIIAVLFIFASSISCTQYHARGAGVGGTLGGVAGALLDDSNRWRGGVWGAALGAIAGASLTEISMQASRESAQNNRPVEYRTTDGRGRYQAYPVDFNEQTKCHKVQERIWEDERMIKNQVKEICEGERTEQRY